MLGPLGRSGRRSRSRALRNLDLRGHGTVALLGLLCASCGGDSDPASESGGTTCTPVLPSEGTPQNPYAVIVDEVDADGLVRRAREILDADALLADALLDQRVASGIGNVYKSEVLFIERFSPATPIAGVDDRDLGRCFETAADLLRRNLGGGRRVTRIANDQAGRLWVYGRGGQPCLVCDTPIRSRRIGRHHRGTYWCPVCQADERVFRGQYTYLNRNL